MLRVRRQHIVQGISAGFDVSSELRNAFLGKCAWDVEFDLFLNANVLHRALLQVEGVCQVSFVKPLVTMLDVVAA